MSHALFPLSVSEAVPAGYHALSARPGDVLLCHRSGFASAAIRGGERLRFQSGARWSHCALVETPTTIIEALTHGVKRSSLSAYTNTDYMLIHTQLDGKDAMRSE